LNDEILVFGIYECGPIVQIGVQIPIALATHQPDLPSYTPRAPPANNPIVDEIVNQLDGTNSSSNRLAAIIPISSEIEPPTSRKNFPLESMLHSLAMLQKTLSIDIKHCFVVILQQIIYFYREGLPCHLELVCFVTALGFIHTLAL
tara:strand:+ start:1184 stop:1621 length:438 start_codon:yes stop_codon:yes gene_type:complete